ncbi:MAG: peroxide stress protein YaaA [Myxococcales bacterium]|nr:peroxide stress protein YaaA [Myxococcales bacterium]
MLAVLSPAKKLNLQPAPADIPWTQPALWRESERMMTKAKNLSRTKLRKLMNISADLAELNWQRHNQFEKPFTPANAKQAALCFNGDVYWGLDPSTITAEQWQWAQGNLAILSGMFGILRPLDLIQAYRLEMGTLIPSRRGKNLYDYWGESVTMQINETTKDHADRTLVNIASGEYSRVIRPKKLAGGMITIAFKELRPDGPKMIGVVAKRSRGKFARWMATEQVETREQLKAFCVDDYAFDPGLSDDAVWTFSRVDVAGRMQAEFQARKLRDASA